MFCFRNCAIAFCIYCESNSSPLTFAFSMTAILHPSVVSPTAPVLEACIRTALELRELSPGLESHIRDWANRHPLSEQDQTLLQLLQDAIDAGCIRRVGL